MTNRHMNTTIVYDDCFDDTDGEVTRNDNYRMWLREVSMIEDQIDYIISTHPSANYYGGAGRTVDTHRIKIRRMEQDGETLREISLVQHPPILGSDIYYLFSSWSNEDEPDYFRNGNWRYILYALEAECDLIANPRNGWVPFSDTCFKIDNLGSYDLLTSEAVKQGNFSPHREQFIISHNQIEIDRLIREGYRLASCDISNQTNVDQIWITAALVWENE